MIPSQVNDLFRAECFDQEEPFLWSDLEVSAFRDAAQEMFVRLTGGIQDATTTLAQLAVVATQSWINYSPLILRIISATLRSTGLPIAILNPPDLVDYRGSQWSPKSINLPGNVCAIVLGLDDTKVRVVQVPQVSDTIDMVIERLPAQTPTVSGAFEIQAQHHYYLLGWMKHLAYLKQDAETFDKKKALEEGANFEAYCKQAFLEKERRKQKHRLIQYGGIGGTAISTTTTWPQRW